MKPFYCKLKNISKFWTLKLAMKIVLKLQKFMGGVSQNICILQHFWWIPQFCNILGIFNGFGLVAACCNVCLGQTVFCVIFTFYISIFLIGLCIRESGLLVGSQNDSVSNKLQEARVLLLPRKTMAAISILMINKPTGFSSSIAWLEWSLSVFCWRYLV